MAGKEKIGLKDFIALFLAFIQTIFLPLILFIIIVVIIVLMLSIVRPVENATLQICRILLEI